VQWPGKINREGTKIAKALVPSQRKKVVFVFFASARLKNDSSAYSSQVTL
jgi:hypothetical protein